MGEAELNLKMLTGKIFFNCSLCFFFFFRLNSKNTGKVQLKLYRFFEITQADLSDLRNLERKLKMFMNDLLHLWNIFTLQSE